MTLDLMILRDRLNDLNAAVVAGGGIVVPTTTLLPTGALAAVRVERAPDSTFTVTDEGAARAALADSGVERVRPADRRRASEIAHRAGLAMIGDAFTASNLTEAQVPAAIAYVAEAAREWAVYLTERVGRLREADVADMVREQLLSVFSPSMIEREAVIRGASNTRHRFDFVVHLTEVDLAVFEIVSPAPQSIAAVHLKFADLERRQSSWLREGVVASMSGWGSESLALLSQVCTHVRPVGSRWDDLGTVSVH